MTLWIILTVLTAAAAALVAMPFIRKLDEADSTSATSVEVYRDQLAEVDREQKEGLIDEAEAAASRVEIERRILTAVKTENASTQGFGRNWEYRAVTTVAAFVVMGSVGLYAITGRPDVPASHYVSQTAVQSGAAAGQNIADVPVQQAAQPNSAADEAKMSKEITSMVQRLEERLKENPNDAEGWRVLGWSYYNTGKYKPAIDAYKKAAELQPDNVLVKALMGEALVKEAGGKVTDEAISVFDTVLVIEPNEPRARFFKGLAKVQRGDQKGAIDAWIEMLKTAPQDAEWRADLREQVVSLARETGIDISGRLPDPGEQTVAEASPNAPKGPSAEDIENAKNMPKDDQQEMIRGMVDGLASKLEANPKNADGWIMLIRSRLVLNQKTEAEAELKKAKEAFDDEPETQQRITQAAKAMGLEVN